MSDLYKRRKKETVNCKPVVVGLNAIPSENSADESSISPPVPAATASLNLARLVLKYEFQNQNKVQWSRKWGPWNNSNINNRSIWSFYNSKRDHTLIDPDRRKTTTCQTIKSSFSKYLLSKSRGRVTSSSATESMVLPDQHFSKVIIK